MGVSDFAQLSLAADSTVVHTWDDATAKWFLEKADKASLHSDRCIIRWLDLHLRGVPLVDITRPVVDAITLKKIASGVANGTVNRMLALLRSILRRACFDWEWMGAVPKVR